MDTTTKYLGLALRHPLVVGASPMARDLDVVRRLEDAGAGAVMMSSLFEEQLVQEQMRLVAAYETGGLSAESAGSFLPAPEEYALGPDDYLEMIQRLKAAVGIPVVASLNGTSLGGWLHHARLMQDAGADALELNVYGLPTDAAESGEQIERRTLAMVSAVKAELRIPVAVKLSPFYTSIAHFVHRLDEAGADGVVLFNRFYQADIDVENLELRRELKLSTSSELLLRLRWAAILSRGLRASLAITGGVHTAEDAVKAVMAGAHAVQLVSALLRHGPEYLRLVREEFDRWVAEHGYESVAEMRGCMNLSRCPDPAAYERANYVQMLQSWRGWE